MNLILANGTTFTPIIVTGETKYVQGANRDVLTFVFGNVSLDEIDSLFTEANCESIQLVTETVDEETGEANTSVDVHEGYVIRTELKKETETVQQSTSNTDAIYESRVKVSMAQRTYSETKLASLQEQSDLLAECVLDMSSVVYAE